MATTSAVNTTSLLEEFRDSLHAYRMSVDRVFQQKLLSEYENLNYRFSIYEFEYELLLFEENLIHSDVNGSSSFVDRASIHIDKLSQLLNQSITPFPTGNETVLTTLKWLKVVSADFTDFVNSNSKEKILSSPFVGDTGNLLNWSEQTDLQQMDDESFLQFLHLMMPLRVHLLDLAQWRNKKTKLNDFRIQISDLKLRDFQSHVCQILEPPLNLSPAVVDIWKRFKDINSTLVYYRELLEIKMDDTWNGKNHMKALSETVTDHGNSPTDFFPLSTFNNPDEAFQKFFMVIVSWSEIVGIMIDQSPFQRESIELLVRFRNTAHAIVAGRMGLESQERVSQSVERLARILADLEAVFERSLRLSIPQTSERNPLDIKSAEKMISSSGDMQHADQFITTNSDIIANFSSRIDLPYDTTVNLFKSFFKSEAIQTKEIIKIAQNLRDDTIVDLFRLLPNILFELPLKSWISLTEHDGSPELSLLGIISTRCLQMAQADLEKTVRAQVLTLGDEIMRDFSNERRVLKNFQHYVGKFIQIMMSIEPSNVVISRLLVQNMQQINALENMVTNPTFSMITSRLAGITTVSQELVDQVIRMTTKFLSSELKVHTKIKRNIEFMEEFQSELMETACVYELLVNCKADQDQVFRTYITDLIVSNLQGMGRFMNEISRVCPRNQEILNFATVLSSTSEKLHNWKKSPRKNVIKKIYEKSFTDVVTAEKKAISQIELCVKSIMQHK